MKKIATAALTFSLLLSACLPAFAQLTKSGGGAVGSSAQFDKVEAFSDVRGVLVRWQMVSETRNAGFYVYRVGPKSMERVSQTMVLGSTARLGDRTLPEESYQQYDPQGTSSTIYVVQSVTMDGIRILSSQTSANFVPNLSMVAGRTTKSFEIAAQSTTGDIEKTILPELSAPEKSPDLMTQRAVVAKPGVKIGIKADGFYRVTRAELQAAGFNLASTSANWRLFMEGIEQAILVGANDQYIEFYGKGRDDIESDTRVYYLIADTTGGKRMENGLMKSIFGTVAANNFQATVLREQRTTYFKQLRNGDGDNYFGDAVISPDALQSTIIPVNLPGADTGSAGNANVSWKMIGYVLGNHTVKLMINGHDAGNITGSDLNNFSGQKTVPAAFLVDGPNRFEMTSGSTTDQSLFDSFTVTYPRKFQANQNTLLLSSPGRKTAILSGFSSPNIRVFDISIDGRPMVVPALQTVQNGCSYGVKLPSYRGRNLFAQSATPDPRTAAAANWNVDTDEATLTGHQFFTGMRGQVTSTGTLPGGIAAVTDYYVRVSGCDSVALYDTLAHATNLASTTGKINITSTGSGSHTFTPSSVLQAASVTPNVPSTLSTVNHNANMVIISYSAPDFMAAANTWANYRRSQGFTVEVVDVADIFDEFSYGSFSSQSVKDFLSFSRTWNTPPHYVLLIGDASYDPRNYEGFGFDLVPSKRFDSYFDGETVSDDALADFDNDGLAELAIGRIPAHTAADITTIFNKTTAFETAAQQSLSRGGTFAYDVPDVGDDFQANCQAIRTQLPGSMPVDMIYRGAAGSSAALINSLNTGKYIVNYCGHGTSGVWATQTFFAATMVPQLTNATRQSIFTMLTCLNGYFIRLDADSLAEVLVKSPTGGAAAAWASSAETTSDIQTIMGKRFYGEIASGNTKRIGDLVVDAKSFVPYDPDDVDVRYSWVLFGDPMLKIVP